jgi:hypothetical protein
MKNALICCLLAALVGCKPQGEAGLMEVDQKRFPGGIGADIDGDGVANDIHWETPLPWPLRVELSATVTPEYRACLVRAIDEINLIAGRIVLSAPVPADGFIATLIEVGGAMPRANSIFVLVDQDTRGHATTFHNSSGSLFAATLILLEEVEPGVNRCQVTLHEVLHGLGFDHDNFDSASVMHPEQQRHQQKITDADKALMRRIFGGTAA